MRTEHGSAPRSLIARRLERAGWERYPLLADVNGGFREDMNLIRGMLGSDCYEWQRVAGRFWIRRAG